MDHQEDPYQRVTARLKEKGSTEGRGGVWNCPVPSHGQGKGDESKSLSVKRADDDKVLLHCFAGCSIDEICAALELETKELRPRILKIVDREGCTLEQYAEVTGIDVATLQSFGLDDRIYQRAPAVLIPYLGKDGQKEVARRYRMEKDKPAEGPDQRFRWRQGSTIVPYGLWKLEDAKRYRRIALVEGESDCHVLWAQGFPALGIPGAATWKAEWAELLQDFDRIYAIEEPDAAGEKLIASLAPALGDQLYVVRLPEKDPRALYRKDPEGFKAAFRAACKEAVHWPERDRVERQRRRDERRQELMEKAAELLDESDLLTALESVLPRVNIVGESTYAKILYLCLTSRVLRKPVSVVGKGPSSAGKSFVLQGILDLMPPSAYYTLSGMSEHALAYSKEPLAHRHLVIYEASGMESDFQSYLIRSMLSEGRIRYETVVKEGGELVSKLIEREGPTGLIVTTTALMLHPENETRILSVTADDSRDQTRRVIREILKPRVKQPQDWQEPWHALQEWIALQPTAVSIPYAEALAEQIDPVAVRLRRDTMQLRSLIEAHALLHQQTRERDDDGAVVATLEDYRAIRELVGPVIAEGVQLGVTPTMRETVEAVDRMQQQTDPREEWVTANEVVAELGLDRSTVLRRLRAAAHRGFLRNLETKLRQPARYVTDQPLPGYEAFLPAPEALDPTASGNEAAPDAAPETPAGSPAPTESEPQWQDSLVKLIPEVQGHRIWKRAEIGGSWRRLWQLRNGDGVVLETDDPVTIRLWYQAMESGELPTAELENEA